MNETLLREAVLAVCDLIEAEIGTNNPHIAKVRKAVKGKGKEAKETKGGAK